MARKSILVVDDEKSQREILEMILSGEGYDVTTASSGEAALKFVEDRHFDLVLTDLKMTGMSGIDLLKELVSRDKSVMVILLTAHGTVDSAFEAKDLGAFAYLQKPYDREKLLETVSRSLTKLETLDSEIISVSAEMDKVKKLILKVAKSNSTVLIRGESGTGKELIARSIHQNSPRKDKNFVAVNCGALTESLLEAELFGHTKGSFTGAMADRRGLWEEAEGGTLFLDEIGETSLAMQVKLLRALQEGEIRRVGSTNNRKIDARIIAATNRNLEEEVKNGNFREDLFYRLSVVTLNVPPLRERPTDISILVEKFLSKARKNVGKENLRFSEDALKTLQTYEWKGNVRELEAAVEYAALRVRGNEILTEDLPVKLLSGEFKQSATRFHLSQLYGDLPKLDELEKRYLIHLLEKTKANRTRTAEILGIDRRTLYRMAERFGIELD